MNEEILEMADPEARQVTVPSGILPWVTAIVLSAVAFATIGVTASDNKDRIIKHDDQIDETSKLVTGLRIQSKEQEIRQQAIMAGLNDIKVIVSNLERAD